MSAQSVESILSKAMSDSKFADALFADPEKALAGFDLTPTEKDNLKNLSRAEFDKVLARTPEERKSFALTDNHNQAALRVK